MQKVQTLSRDREKQQASPTTTGFAFRTYRVGARGTVLVIESEKLIRNWLQWVLHSRGYEVWTAATTREADMQRCRVGADHLDLVIVDVHLKATSNGIPLAGYQLYQMWTQSYPTIPFLLMSDHRHDRYLIAVKEGAVPLLVKRFLIVDLIEVVRRLCRRTSPTFDASMPVALSA